MALLPRGVLVYDDLPPDRQGKRQKDESSVSRGSPMPNPSIIALSTANPTTQFSREELLALAPRLWPLEPDY